MDNPLRVLVALPRPLITLLAEEGGEVVPVARWEEAPEAWITPPLCEVPQLDAVIGALQSGSVRLLLLPQATVEALQMPCANSRPTSLSSISPAAKAAASSSKDPTARPTSCLPPNWGKCSPAGAYAWPSFPPATPV